MYKYSYRALHAFLLVRVAVCQLRGPGAFASTNTVASTSTPTFYPIRTRTSTRAHIHDFSSRAQAQVQAEAPRLPVGIFIDLDNVEERPHSRAEARALVKPLRTFVQRIGGEIVAFQGFGNEATQTFINDRQRISLDADVWGDWDRENHRTGRDRDGCLRCGVCGAKMKLTNKDLKSGRSEAEKLHKHMKKLHEPEETKRRNKRMSKRLSQKEAYNSKKYRSSQVGLRLVRGRNDLFTVLSEVGIRCHSAANVDAILMRNAIRWMDRLPTARPFQHRGCLVVLSEDSDFGSLFDEAHQRGLLVVSATLEDKQTLALEQASDLVLRNGGASTPVAVSLEGVAFLNDMEFDDEDWDLDCEDDGHDDILDVDTKWDFAIKADTKRDQLTTQIPVERVPVHTKKTIRVAPLLDLDNKNNQERTVALVKALSHTKKTERKALLQTELQIRLVHKDSFNFARKYQAGLRKLALMLHWVERGYKTIPGMPDHKSAKKISRKPIEAQKKELQARGLKSTGSKKQILNRLQAAITQGYDAKWLELAREALVDRGLDVNGNKQEDMDYRLARAVLGMDDIRSKPFHIGGN